MRWGLNWKDKESPHTIAGRTADALWYDPTLKQRNDIFTINAYVFEDDFSFFLFSPSLRIFRIILMLLAATPYLERKVKDLFIRKTQKYPQRLFITRSNPGIFSL